MNSSFDCFTRIWREHEAELRGFLMHRTGSPADAEDFLQTVFLKAIQQGSKLCAMQNPRAWLFQVARNSLIDHHRTKHHYEALPDQLPAEEYDDDPVDRLSECLPRTLSELSDDDREIITLCDLDGLPQAEFATLKGIGLSAAKSRLQRARKRLKEVLKRNCQISFDDAGKVCCFVPRPPLK